jgi:hypothetical protein
MQNIKENVQIEISKWQKCINWDINELRNQINFVFDNEDSSIDSSIETLNEISIGIEKIKILLNLLK